MKHSRRLLFSLSLLFSLGMLVFTFVTLAWFSDEKGFEWGFEIPISTENGLLSTLTDAVWMAAPFFAVLSLFLFLVSETGKKAGILLSSLPLALYAILRGLSYLDGNESHPILFVTLFSLVLLGTFTATGAFVEEVRRISAYMAFFYGAMETLLLIFSMIFREKYSLFYFFQLIPLGHTSYLEYSFFTISIYLYYLFYALSLGCRLLLPAKNHTEEAPKPPEKPRSKEEAEESEEDYSSLSLEDLGISR